MEISPNAILYDCLSSFGLDNIDYFQALFISSPTPIFILDERGEPSNINNAFHQLTGYKEADFSYKKLIADDFFDTALLHFQQALKGEVQIFDTIAQTRTLKKINLNITLIPFKVSAEIFNVFAFTVNIIQEEKQHRDLLKVQESLNQVQRIGSTGSWNYDVIEQDMRIGLKNNQFEVYYQPRVCAKKGIILSAEALIRWIHPKLGSVNPEEFIPIAEENGFIHEIEDFVISNVCRQIKVWQQQNLITIPISVNVSAKCFFKSDLVTNITKNLRNNNINGHLLELEITESSILYNMEKVKEVIGQVKQLGVRIALDDFGTGFSSLTHLRALDIDTIKIDRSFIQNITTQKQDETITTCIIQLANGLNMDVVAEGVETKEQLKLLQQSGCKQIQGYLYSKPVHVKEFTSILKKRYLEVNNN